MTSTHNKNDFDALTKWLRHTKQIFTNLYGPLRTYVRMYGRFPGRIYGRCRDECTNVRAFSFRFDRFDRFGRFDRFDRFDRSIDRSMDRSCTYVCTNVYVRMDGCTNVRMYECTHARMCRSFLAIRQHKKRNSTFYPSAKSRRELEIRTNGVICHWEFDFRGLSHLNFWKTWKVEYS